MHDGTTPLILAARLAVEGMVEELINCHADVNATDDFGKVALFYVIHKYQSGQTLESIKCIRQTIMTLFFSSGKSALHWAAAVNNVEAAIVLLKNGANKDMQNNKVLEQSVYHLVKQ